MRLAFGRPDSRPFQRRFARFLLALAGLMAGASPAASQGGLSNWHGSFEVMSAPTTTSPLQAAQPANAPVTVSRRAISADGRYVVFSTSATNLAMGAGIHRRDRRTGVTQNLVTGTQVRNPALSADGNHLIYEQCSPTCQIYGKDLRTSMPAVAMSASNGVPGNFESLDPVVSATGRYVVFSSKATNLWPNPGALRQVVIRDRDTDADGLYDEAGAVQLQVVSQPDGVQGSWGGADSDTAEVSDDGRYVAFRSVASNLVPGDTNSVVDVFLRDRQTSQTRRLNVRPDGSQSAHPIVEPKISISGDGRYVAFASGDAALVATGAPDLNGTLDVFVHDRTDATLTRLDFALSAGSVVPGNGPTGWPTLSADGRYVSMQSSATNVGFPVTPNIQVYVFDRSLPGVGGISSRLGEVPANQAATSPALSPDGTVVLISTSATNLAPIAGTPPNAQVQAAARATIGPPQVLVSALGGTGSFDITAQANTRWSVAVFSQPWATPLAPTGGFGTTALAFRVTEANPQMARRTMNVSMAGVVASLVQEAGLSLISTSPNAGPMSGGTAVTLNGTGFVAGMTAWFGGVPAETTFVNTTTLVAIAPPSTTRQPVTIVLTAPDERSASLDGGYFYLDDTPPSLVGAAVGTPGLDGWFTGDVTIDWVASDEQSAVTSTTCSTIVVTADTAGTTYTCTATSEGGTTSASVTIKRDGTAPAIAISAPAARSLLALGSTRPLTFTCTDALSGVAQCGIDAPSGTPVDTSTPGFQSAATSAMDAAGNVGVAQVEYAVDTGVCTLYPEGLATWVNFEWFLSDQMSWYTPQNGGIGQTYVGGMVGMALSFPSRSAGWLSVEHDGRLRFSSGFTFAAWLRPSSGASRILSHPQIRLDRASSGAVTWTLTAPAGQTPVSGTTPSNTLPFSTWSHVALTWSPGVVTLYVNGRAVQTWDEGIPATLADMPEGHGAFAVGDTGSSSFSPFVGAMDELQFYTRAIDTIDVERLYLAGSRGVCELQHLNMTLTPSSPAWGDGSYPVLLRMWHPNGTPAPGHTVTLRSDVPNGSAPAPETTLVTDAAGEVRWNAPFAAEPGTYVLKVRADFAGTPLYRFNGTSENVVVRKATPTWTWPTPAPITYGTPLGAAQETATANLPGSWSWSLRGMVLGAGTRTITAYFSPTEYLHYSGVSANTTLEILKAVPAMTLTGGTYTYTGYPRFAGWSVTDYAGLSLGSISLTYNGGTAAPVDVGVYTVVATFAGDANHEPRTMTTTITITPATPNVDLSWPMTFVYDGQPHGRTATVTNAFNAVIGSATVTYDGQATPPVNVGTYAVSATYAGTSNYTPRTVTSTLTITPAVPTVTVSGGPFTFDGQPHAATVTVTGVGGEAVGNPVTVTYGDSASVPVDAGTYAVSASVAAAGNYQARSATGSITIAKAAATLTLGGGPFVYDGQPHAATVVATGGGGAAVGPVTLTYDGAAATPVAAGTYSVQAIFAGDANHQPASASGTLVIAKATPTLSWPAPAPLTYGAALSTAALNATASVPGTFAYTPALGTVLDAGASHTLSATFTPADAANYEGGSVTTTIAVLRATATVAVTGGAFTYDGQPHAATASATGVGGVALTPVTLTYDGAPAAPVAAGTYEVVASFAGDGNHEPATASATLTIGQASVSLAWSTPAPIGYGTPLGAAQLAATASVPGTFVYAPAAGTVLAAGGGHALTATFTPADPANYAGGAVGTTIAVIPASLTVRTMDAAKVFGAPVPAFTASFTGLVSGDTPAGLSGALAFTTAATSDSAVGVYPVTPGGLASPNYAITFAAGTLTVTRAPVAMTLDSSPQPSGADMPIALTAMVAAAQSAPTAPTGTVRFFDGATLLGSATLAGGTATLTTGGLSAGSHTIEARYDSDASFDLGTRTATHVVNAPAATPAITMTSSRHPANVGQSITFTATITVATAGTIQFYDGATLLGSGAIASGRATLTTSALAAGSHAIWSRFTGTAAAPPVFSPVFVQAVNANGWKDRASTLSLASSANPSPLGAAVTFTATVSGTSGTPTGRIVFLVDGFVVGDPAGIAVTTVSSSAAQAAITVPNLAGGRHKVTATYLGSSNYRGSSGALTQTVN